jgi:tetratricopeptide (TPR) repeat protein
MRTGIRSCVYVGHNYGSEKDEIIENCKKAIELEPDNYEAYFLWGSILHFFYGDREQLTKAIEICTAIIKNNPQDINALLYRAEACYEGGSVADAIKDYSRIIEIDPLNIRAYDRRAWIKKFSFHDDSEAIKDYLKIIEIDPENIIAYHNIASIKYDHDDFPGAIDAFTRIIEINPDDEVYYDRGSAKEKLHLYQEALEDYDLAIGIKDDNNYYSDCARVKEKMNDLDGAIQYYLKAIESDDLSDYLRLCKLYYKRKEYDKAKDVLSKMVTSMLCFTTDDFSRILEKEGLHDLIKYIKKETELYFQYMGGGGTVYCKDCGYKEDIIHSHMDLMKTEYLTDVQDTNVNLVANLAI